MWVGPPCRPRTRPRRALPSSISSGSRGASRSRAAGSARSASKLGPLAGGPASDQRAAGHRRAGACGREGVCRSDSGPWAGPGPSGSWLVGAGHARTRSRAIIPEPDVEHHHQRGGADPVGAGSDDALHDGGIIAPHSGRSPGCGPGLRSTASGTPSVAQIQDACPWKKACQSGQGPGRCRSQARESSRQPRRNFSPDPALPAQPQPESPSGISSCWRGLRSSWRGAVGGERSPHCRRSPSLAGATATLQVSCHVLGDQALQLVLLLRRSWANPRTSETIGGVSLPHLPA